MLRYWLAELMMAPVVWTFVRYPAAMEGNWLRNVMHWAFDLVAPNYEELVDTESEFYSGPLREGLSSLKERGVELDRVADLATGTGYAAFRVASRFPGSTVEGWDISEAMVEEARKNAQRRGVSRRVKFRVGDAADLPHAAETFNLVVCQNAPVYLREAGRVLKQGGHLLISFALAGLVFDKSRAVLRRRLEEAGLQLLQVVRVGRGAFILAQKTRRKTFT